MSCSLTHILFIFFQLPQESFLASLLERKDLPLSLAIAGLGVAFLLGAMHAMSPGHGKTLVAAYLVGSRGTLKHAAFLGALVTFTHTISVFLLGLATLFLSQYILPEKIAPWLGVISGASIVVIGASLFWRRLLQLRGKDVHHQHGHHHHHHSHAGSSSASHVIPPGEITMASLIALGVSGGLVPCPSALVLLLSAVAIGRTGFGLLLLIAFSFGLALVLISIGAAVIYAARFVPAFSVTENRFFKLIPVLSAVVIVCVGVLMTGASLGIFKPIG